MTPSDPAVPANLSIGPLSLWILGRTYPDAVEPWDRDWLSIKAVAQTRLGDISLEGIGARSGEIAAFARNLETIYGDLSGECWLDASDLGLTLHVRFADNQGHLAVELKMSPDFHSEFHTLLFSLDQTYLPGIVEQCRRILETFPTTLAPGNGG